MADSGFDNVAYWSKREVEKAFRTEWYRWRTEMQSLYGPRFVADNKQMFTQRSFMTFLEKAAELQGDGPGEQLEAPAPPEPIQVEAPVSGEAGSNVIVTDLAPGN